MTLKAPYVPMQSYGKTPLKLAGYAPIWLVHRLSGLMPPATRSAVWAALGGFLALRVPMLRKRMSYNLDIVFPNMAALEKTALMRKIGQNTGRGYSELLFNGDLAKRVPEFTVSGPGLAALKAAKGKGAIIVSGHFGQWEAIRHYLKAQGMECAAVYKPNTNGFYNDLFLRNMKLGGEPMFENGSGGTRAMLRHLRAGGFAALLLDQRFGPGEAIDFLGHPALTSTVAAELALKYKIPLIAAYGTRGADNTIAITFEEPVPHSDAMTMTKALNDSLSARVFAAPEQWYWLHRRWKYTAERQLAQTK